MPLVQKVGSNMMPADTTQTELPATSKRATLSAHAHPIACPGITVPIHGSSKRQIHIVPDPNRGMVRKLSDTLLRIIGRNPYLDPFMRKLWD